MDAPQPWPSPREEEQDDLLQQRHESLKRQQHQWLLQRRGWLNRRQEWLNQQLREAESEDTREG